ncbi:hypothetical protein WH47_09442 [Habropoda laboriosa]|uniref:Uncharacterized protein n=1 Tax=Habropoda laboriosa TaxID=597456 RepID=A0A0L7RF91_9HYME|nr:hypothetical protein WH47_09442 [Habropoda laboriosa]
MSARKKIVFPLKIPQRDSSNCRDSKGPQVEFDELESSVVKTLSPESFSQTIDAFVQALIQFSGLSKRLNRPKLHQRSPGEHFDLKKKGINIGILTLKRRLTENNV